MVKFDSFRTTVSFCFLLWLWVSLRGCISSDRVPGTPSLCSRYAPLSVRLAQLLARPGWRSVQDALSLLPGPTLQEEQPAPAAARNRRDTGPLGLSADDARLTLVVFLGGVTFAEVAALRFLSSQEDGKTPRDRPGRGRVGVVVLR